MGPPFLELLEALRFIMTFCAQKLSPGGLLPKPQPMAEDTEMYEEYISDEVVPSETRKLRACMICGLVKTFEQFNRNECENCKVYLSAADFVESCTTTNFEGLISLMKPESSWVAKWQRTSMFKFSFQF